ncbi:PQQ-binding-like beta-propeller repeat protein [Streptomyces canus]
MGRGVRSSPTVAGNVVYLSSDDGFPRALDTTSGQVR